LIYRRVFIIVNGESVGHHEGIIGNPVAYDPEIPLAGLEGAPYPQGGPPIQQYGQQQQYHDNGAGYGMAQQQAAYGQAARAANQNGGPGNFQPNGDHHPAQYYGGPPAPLQAAGPYGGGGGGARYGSGGGPGPVYGGGQAYGGSGAYGGGARPAAGPAAVPPPHFGGGGGGAVARNDAPARILPISSLNPFSGRWTIKGRVTIKTEMKR
jgi:replication factor A1